MIGTVSAARESSGRRGPLTSSATLTLGLIVGASVTFAALAVLGAVLAPSGQWLLAAAIICLGAAVADVAGVRIRPQIRAQVPELWRRTMPLPLAMLLYGLLLGTGLSSAVPAFAALGLMLMSVAVGSLSLAVEIGFALAVGRALPVLAAVTVRGLEQLLTEHPPLLRVVRAIGALALAVAASGIVVPSGASAVVSPRATDPSVAGADVAWEDPARGGVLAQGSARQLLPGHDPAIGGQLVAWHRGSLVTVAERNSLLELFKEPVLGVRQLALSDDWLVLRQLGPAGRTRIIAQSIADTSVRKVLASVYAPTTLGRPAISGTTVVFSGGDGASSWITAVDITKGKSTRVRQSTSDQLLGPSLRGTSLLFVDIGRCAQTLRVGALGGKTDRALLTRPPLAGADGGYESGHTLQGRMTPCRRRLAASTTMLWTTALTNANAYVTALDLRGGGLPAPSLIRVAR
jgi:hypothetical protein